MNVTRPGRYALDRAGKLHPLRRRYWADIVAIVHVRPLKKCGPQGTPTADDASGCEGRAADTAPAPAMAPVPDVTIRPAAVRAEQPVRIEPVNARQSRPKIDLSHVPSSMELRAASWKGRP